MAAYVAAKRGPKDGVFCNDRAKEVVEAYTDAAKEIHGQDFDVMNEPLDPGVVYKAGLGKKHGRHLMGDGFLDSRVSLSQGRRRSNASRDEIHSSKRARTSTDRIRELESKLDQMQQLLFSMQGSLNSIAAGVAGGSTPVTLLSTPNDNAAGVGSPVAPLSSPGTHGSIGNAGAPHVDGDGNISPDVPHMDETDN